MTTTRRRAGAAAATAVVLALGASSCTGDDDGDAPEPDGDAAPTAAAVTTTATLGTVTGDLPKQRRRQVRTKVAEVVDAWVDAAYVGGEWPRADFDDAFPGFTERARAEARRDGRLLTNRAIGERVDDVVATQRRVRVDVLAVRKRPVGVTARVLLGFDTTGEVERSEVVRGRLYLTWRGDGWKVFGYDLTRSVRGQEKSRQQQKQQKQQKQQNPKDEKKGGGR